MFKLEIKKDVPKDLKTANIDWYRTNGIPGTFTITYQEGELSFKHTLGFTIHYHGSVNAVCGAGTITNFLVIFRERVSSLTKTDPFSTPTTDILAMNARAFNQVKDEILQYMAEVLMAKASGTLTFGGRCNLDKIRYASTYGVHSGSFAKYVAKKKIGTITCSHLHHNSIHRKIDDFSVQQVFIWSPPAIPVLPNNRQWCGVFGNSKHVVDSLNFIKDFFKDRVTDDWVFLKPRYTLKNPFTPNEHGLRQEQ